MYTTHKLNSVKGILPEIKKKFMLENVDIVCNQCFVRLKTSEQWYVKSQIIYGSKKKLLNSKTTP
jgi:hypothetical protein